MKYEQLLQEIANRTLHSDYENFFELAEESKKRLNGSYDQDSVEAHITRFLGPPKRDTFYLKVPGIQDPDAIAREIIEEAKKTPVRQKGLETSVTYTWSPDEFLALKNLDTPYSSRVSIKKEKTTIDPSKTRMEGHTSLSWIQTSVRNWKLIVNSLGEYKTDVEGLLPTDLTRWSTEVVLSPQDAQRFQRRKDQVPWYVKGVLKLIKTKDKGEEIWPGLIFPHVEQGGLILRGPARLLQLLEEMLQKPVVTSTNDNDVSFSRRYSLFELWRGNPLQDMQHIARQIGKLDSDKQYGRPLIDYEQARDHISRELKELQEGFASIDNHRKGSDIDKWSQEIKRLAISAGGERLEALIDNWELDSRGKMNVFGKKPQQVPRFVEELVKLGYERQPIMKVPRMYTQQVVMGIKFISELVTREAHLVHYLTQMFDRDPKPMIDGYREDFKESPPTILIENDREYKADKMSKMQIPEGSKIRALRISPKYFINSNLIGELSIGDSLGIHTDLTNPFLQHLQNAALDAASVQIN